MKATIIKVVSRLNVSRLICNHLLSESHTDRHRIFVGILFMSGGVMVTQIPVALHSIHLLLDGLGYGIHGIGLTPIIEKFIKITKEPSPNVNQTDNLTTTPNEEKNDSVVN